TLEGPKYEVEKSRVRATQRRNVNHANGHYRDRHAASVTRYVHGEIPAMKNPSQNATSITPSL
ncbi:MAG: hypothetical protein ACREDA_12070, partial [Methylocella sp.]